MMESNPYLAVSGSSSYQQPYSLGGGGGGWNSTFPVVRLRGLPFDCSDIDIFKFFAGLDIVDVLLVNKSGRFSGEAFVVFAGMQIFSTHCFMQTEFALQRDHQNMGRRYVEVFRCTKQEYYRAVAAEVKYEGAYDEYGGTNSPPPSRSRSKKSTTDKDKLDDEYTEILKLRGLPFSATNADIIKFFGEDFELTDDKILIAVRPDGKATGEAYVEFASEDEAKKAMCKDKMTLGSRYVELFASTPEDARRAKSRSRQ
ncbi:hypothetical protein GIB67_030057 [Kingdonia uniflora]|uniref:RRM domain-containing protein n=1 Tax=Kingdonia uniflora TaxID=39325 RepID=A0A7J7MXX1_9MAGN|nr:hypothetical protein GIB67_030057 [Kingdonia uniflora]